MRKLLLLALLVGGCGWAKDQVGLGPTPEEIAAKKAEEKLKLETADQQVQQWANELAENTNTMGGYVHHEGITEPDPWDNYLRVAYTQDGTKEILEVRSSGPDGTFETSDDIFRHRSTGNLLGIGWLPIIAGVWIGGGLIAWLLSSGWTKKRITRARAKGRHKIRRPRPAASGIFSVLAAPLALPFYAFMFIGESVVHGFDLDTDFFDGDFLSGIGGGGIDFDIDIDF
jgi:hypothetical protein